VCVVLGSNKEVLFGAGRAKPMRMEAKRTKRMLKEDIV
jgi:hypothetical protein